MWVYEAYEVKKKGENYAVLYFYRKKIFFLVFMKSLLHRKKKNAPLFTTVQQCLLCRTRAWAIGCAPPRQPRTATCDLELGYWWDRAASILTLPRVLSCPEKAAGQAKC